LVLQSALILLPVATLSAIALYSLRQDKAAILQDARDRALAIAPDIARRMGARVQEILAGQLELQGVIANGQVESPPDSAAPPAPPDWPDLLTAEQAQLWRAALEAVFQRQDAEAGRKALTQFLRASTAPAARANAEFALLSLDAGRIPPAELARRYVDLARRFPRIVTDSGAPLPAIALLAALRAAGARQAPEGFVPQLARHVHESPSFLSAQLLDEAGKIPGPYASAEVRKIREEWSVQQTIVEALRALLRAPPPAGAALETWVHTSSGRFLALATPTANGWQVTLLPALPLQNAFRQALSGTQPLIPPHTALSVQLAGERWGIGAGMPRQAGLVPLAGATGNLAIRTPRPFTLEIQGDEATLYASYRTRRWQMVALILSAAAASLAGLLSFWRGLERQVRLGEMQSNFVSSVSHELRAPIGAVRLMAESLERDKVPDPARQKEYFRLIAQECRRLSSLVENVLDFSRLDSGRKQYSFQPVDLLPLLRQALDLMQPFADERRIRLALVPPVDGAAALKPCWDGHAIEQSLVNLLDNAIKHSPDEATVKLEVEPIDAGIRLWVADSGAGIPREEQSRIFDLFYRRGSELRRETKGAGIGLSIVKHVVEAHGGRVLVESAVGRGSRFGLELPLAERS
jgi:signal transduction histidine kinase